jgi:hypothetical protein
LNSYVQETISHWPSFQRRLMSDVTAAYLETREVMEVRQHRDRHSLLTALLAGDPTSRPTYPAGARPAPLYAVMTGTRGWPALGDVADPDQDRLLPARPHAWQGPGTRTQNLWIKR